MKELGKNIVEDAGKKGVGKAIDLIFDNFLNPKIEVITNSPQNILELEEQLKTYLNKKYDIDKYINTIVFHGENKTIEELYIPLTIVQNGKRKNIVLDKSMNNIFDSPIKYLIIDTAGTGKSTLVKFLSTHCIEKSWGYPFVIELRRLEKDQTIEDYILNDVQLICKKVKNVDIKDLIRRGDFIFFLDGYDEIAEDKKDSVTKTIREFVTSSDNNCFIMTSRDDDLLNEFSDFTKFHIKELTKEEAYELIRKYDNYGEVSKSLIDEIEKYENYNTIKEFLKNPLMVSLLYMSYEYNRVLFHEKSTFYFYVYEGLFYRHDKTKGEGFVHKKKSMLDLMAFYKVLCAMGFLSVKYGKVEFTKIEIIQLIKESIDFYPHINTDENYFLDDITHSVPLFKEEGLNYKWVHKSFSEYFAAVFICQESNEHKKDIFNQISKAEKNKKYYNVLDFCYDIDNKSVRECLVYPVLKDYVEHYDTELNRKIEFSLAETEAFLKFVENVFFMKSEKISDSKKFIFNHTSIMKALNDYGISHYDYFNILPHYRLFKVVSKTPKFEIIKLLYRKNIDVFKRAEIETVYPQDFFRKFQNEIYNVFGKNSGLIVENYESIIFYLYTEMGDFQGKILDIDKCRQMVKTIEQEKDKIPSGFFDLC